MEAALDKGSESPSATLHDIHSGLISSLVLLKGLLEPLENIVHDLLICL